MGFLNKVDELMEFKEQFVDKLNVLFGDWALYVYDRPYKMIIISLVLSIIPAFGLFPPIASWVDGADNLYSLPYSEARNDGIIHDHLFQEAISRAEFIAITSEPAGQNLLNWDTLEWVRQIDEMIRGKRADAKTGQIIALPATEAFYTEFYSNPQNKGLTPDKKWLTYEDICAPDPVTGCKVQSIFEMGVDDMKLMIEDGEPPELWAFDGLVFNTLRKGFSPDFVLGKYEKRNCTREMPTSLVSQIYTPDRYTEVAGQAGYSKAVVECIYYAEAFHFVYELWDKPEFLEREMAWEWNFYEVLKNNEHYGPLKIGAMAFRTRDDELSKSTAESDDVIFVVYTFILLIAYAAVINFNIDQYRSKAISSLVGSMACLLGLYAGLGVPALWGTVFVPTALVCPFIVMGVGADDIFVVISSYALTYGEDTPRDRCAVCLRGCGVSVVMTTVTNVIAFAIGIQSQYLSIKNFCIFTLFGLLFSLFYELTLFFAVVCLEAQKEEKQKACLCHSLASELDIQDRKKRFDINASISTYQVVSTLVENAIKDDSLFRLMLADDRDDPSRSATTHKSAFMRKLHSCWREFSTRGNYWFVPSDPNNTEDSAGRNLLDREESYMKFIPPDLVVDRYDLHPKLLCDVYQSEPEHNVGYNWRAFFMKWYCHYLLLPWVKVVVLVVFAGNLSFSLYGVTKMQQGLEMVDLSPDDSYLKQYDHMVAEYLNKVDLPVEMFFMDEGTPWWEPRVIETLREFVQVVNDDPSNFLLVDPLTRMYDDASLAPRLQSGNKTEFLAALHEAVSDGDSAYKQFEYDFVWRGGELASFRQQLLPTGTSGSQERASWMLTLRAFCKQFSSMEASETRHPISPSFYNYMMIFYESDLTITKNVISAISTASMALLVVTLMLIPDMSSGLVVILIMFMIDVSVVGYMPFWDVPLNMISMVILVISIGFAVDYSAHLCYAFVNAVGPSRNIRTAESIVLVGTPLFHGAMSNFLGIVMLGFSTSYILRIFFKMMTLVVLLGISHGLILLPVLLATWGKMAQGQLLTIEKLDKVQQKPRLLISASSNVCRALDIHPAGRVHYEPRERGTSEVSDTENDTPMPLRRTRS